MIFHLVIVDKGRPACWNVRCIIFSQWFLSIPSSSVRYPVNSVWFSHARKRNTYTYALWQILLLSEGYCMHSHSADKAPDTICSFLSHQLSLFTPDPSFQSAETVYPTERFASFFLSFARSILQHPTSAFYTCCWGKSNIRKLDKFLKTNFDYGLIKSYLKVLKDFR